MQHRTWTHSLWIPLSLLILDYLNNDFLLSIFLKTIYIGLFLHIIEDSLTVSGVRIFYPLSFKLRLAKFNTNSEKHSFIFDIFSVILVLSFVYFIF